MLEEQKGRLGVVGLGVMGSIHAKTVLTGNVERFELSAISDIVPTTGKEFPEIPFFNSAREKGDSNNIPILSSYVQLQSPNKN